MKITLRALTAGAAALAGMTLLLTGCSTGTAADSGSSNDAASADAKAFPVTLHSQFGDTTINKAPQRIATIGWANEDAVMALGQVPVGMSKSTFGADDAGWLPWDIDELKRLGAAPGSGKEPKLTTTNADSTPNFDEIAELSPDLIVAVQSSLDQDSFAKLSKIAPVVAYDGAPYSTSWQDMVSNVGKAMGQSAKAEQVVKDTESFISGEAKDNSQLAGKTFVVGTLNPADKQDMNLYTPKDARSRLLISLGLKPSPTVAEAAKDAKNFFVKYSPEKASDLKADIAWFWASDQKQADELAADPLIGQMPAIKNGAYVAVTDNQLAMALSAVSPQSLHWALGRMMPNLDAAAAKANSAK